MEGWCRVCIRTSTLNPAVADSNLCEVCLWKVEALSLDPDYFRRWFERAQGRHTRKMPAVLKTGFELRACPVCRSIMMPWERKDTRRGRSIIRWCTPSEYRHHHKTCSIACGQTVRFERELAEGVVHALTGATRRGRANYRTALSYREQERETRGDRAEAARIAGLA